MSQVASQTLSENEPDPGNDIAMVEGYQLPKRFSVRPSMETRSLLAGLGNVALQEARARREYSISEKSPGLHPD